MQVEDNECLAEVEVSFKGTDLICLGRWVFSFNHELSTWNTSCNGGISFVFVFFFGLDDHVVLLLV